MIVRPLKQFLFGTFLFMTALVFHLNHVESPKVTKVHEYKIHEQMMEHVKLEAVSVETQRPVELR